ncbi:MAG TPA: metallophosphoesterase [Steroidobacteraceae bacterium]|nr:metallophosphoesterase [Steroidobacteraceae bacterium]
MPQPPTGDVTVVHSSDLHVDHDYTARLHDGDGAAGLAAVLQAARDAAADVVILAGDTFESHRVSPRLIERAAALIEAAAMPVVLLPGNHDPAVADAVYGNAAMATLANLHILGIRHDEAVQFPELRLEIWGRAHRDYGDMGPFAGVHPRTTRWLIAVGHGHYQPLSGSGLQPSWLISDADIAGTGADYVALGHWNRAAQVGNGHVPAYYSGSPEFAGTVNLVRLNEMSGVSVTRAPLAIARETAG